MANTGCSAFSSNQQYWAFCGNDGKLKIWETATSRLKQEFIPNLHLSSPCSVIGWITVGQQTSVAPSPWRKRKRKSISEDTEQKDMIAMGSVNGNLTLYDVSSASVSKVLENGHSGCVTAITWSPGHGLFSAGDDHQIVEWNIQDNGIKCKWKSGRRRITALVLPPDEKIIISADQTIKVWDLETKQVLSTFSGHANQITFLRTIKIDDKMSYLVSGAQGDSLLCAWSLNEGKKENTPIASLAMQDHPVSLSVEVLENSQLAILAANRSGQAHLFTYQPNGLCTRPLKPAVTVMIAGESNQKEAVQQVPIQSAHLTTDGKMLLVYGSLINLTIEKIAPDFSSKIMGLVRSDGRKLKEKREETLTKVKVVEADDHVEYLVPGTTSAPKRTKAGSQLPLKDRLENLSLGAEMNISGKTPTKGGNMAQLLLQGLNSKDKNILRNVLHNRDEKIIKNTISKLPVQEISSLLKELTSMLQGKTYPSKIALVWLKNLVFIHAAHLTSHPDIGEMLSPILGLIDLKIALFPEVSRLKGRVALATGQISQFNDQESKDTAEEALLVYQDSDSSDEDTDVGEMEAESGSDDNWAETSEPEEEQEDLENGKSDDDASICS